MKFDASSTEAYLPAIANPSATFRQPFMEGFNSGLAKACAEHRDVLSALATSGIMTWAEGDITREITVSVTGENIGSTNNHSRIGCGYSLIQMSIGKLWSNALDGATRPGLLRVLGLGGGADRGSTITMSGTGLGASTRGLSLPMFVSGKDGRSIVGEMNVPKGARILPDGQTADGGRSVSVPDSINVSRRCSGGSPRSEQPALCRSSWLRRSLRRFRRLG